RRSVAWSLLFIFLLYFTAPAYAAFAKLEVYQNVIGVSMDALPQWIYTYGQLGLVKVCGVDATTIEAIRTACATAGSADNILAHGDLAINNDVIVIAMPEIAGLPYVIAGLVAAGGLAAALSTADGLLLAIANALSHDIYYKMIDPNAATRRRLTVARVLLVIVAACAAWVASTRPADILSMVAWAFSLAAAGNFPALVLGIWWKRCTTAGAVAGMIAGFGITLFYLVATKYGGMPLWPIPGVTDGIQNISAAILGLPLGVAVMIIVSLMTPAPSREMQDFIDEIRLPRGRPLMAEKAT
ncbi:MAG TPA: cation acetate symporter, partial [Afifellaceae bacterium]|nr:cation acetate symporter [Afifellaceae bacterium]